MTKKNIGYIRNALSFVCVFVCYCRYGTIRHVVPAVCSAGPYGAHIKESAILMVVLLLKKNIKSKSSAQPLIV